MKNFRGITLPSSIMKMFTVILNCIIEQQFENSEGQQGFVHNRSAMDAIFTIALLSKKSIEYNKPANLCFIDQNISEILTYWNKQKYPETTKIMKELYATAWNTGTTSGLRQDNSHSPKLFNLILDQIIAEMKLTNIGYKLDKNMISSIVYADDIVVIAEKENDLRRTHKNIINKYRLQKSIQWWFSRNEFFNITT